MCSFESGNENSINDYLIEHVKIPKVKENLKSEIKEKKTNKKIVQITKTLMEN